MECPKCGAYDYAIKTKYLQPIQVPIYAEFQPLEKLSVCFICGFYGKHKLEMLPNGTSLHNIECWTEKELDYYGIKQKKGIR